MQLCCVHGAESGVTDSHGPAAIDYCIHSIFNNVCNIQVFQHSKEGAVFLTSTADSVTSLQVLTNETLLILYLSEVQPENITVFVKALTSSAEKANLTVDQVNIIKRTLLIVQLQKLQSSLASYSTEQWMIFFQENMVTLIPYFNQTSLKILPISIPCASFQAIVKGFNSAFSILSTETKKEIYDSFIKTYMSNQSSPTGVACNTGSYNTWLTLNFGDFIVEVTYAELTFFNTNLTKLQTTSTIAPADLADLTITAELTQNETMSATVITSIKQFKSLQQLNQYIVQLQSYVCAGYMTSGTSLCVSSTVLQNSTKLTVFSAVSEVLLASWTTSNESLWLQNFRITANMFALEFTDSTISQLPMGVTCSTAQEIMTSMNSSYGLLKPYIQNAIYQYLLDYHKASNLACDTSGDLQIFIDNYFEASSALLSSGDLVSLIPYVQLSMKLNSLTAQKLVFYLQPATNRNTTLWSIILSHYTDISKLGQVMDLLHIQTVDITATIFTSVWPTFVSNSDYLNDTEMDEWFNVRFNNTIKLITLEQLNISEVFTANCLFYHNLVKTLSIHYEDYSDDTRQDIYNVFKKYLTGIDLTDDSPRCYVYGDNSWIVQNLQVYLTFCSADDLMSFSNETLLQQFSVDNNTLALVKTLTLKEDLKEYYAQLLTTENPNFPIQNIPQSILCYAIADLNLGDVSGDQAARILNFLKACNYSTNSIVNPDALSGLLSSAPEITPQLLTSIGSAAVGLTTSTIIQDTNASTLLGSLSTLSTISGWSVTQASAIVTKVIQNNYTITAQSLENLGSLAIGVPSSKITSLSSTEILALASNVTFSTYMEQAPVALKQKFVQEVIQASSTKSIFQSVPASLASEIPASNLLTSTLNISEINQMKWTTSQAQVFFRTVLIKTTNYSELSSNILQGFTCGAANNLTNNQFVSLIKSMTGKSVNLDSSPLNCLTMRLTTNGQPADFENYSSDVLLYLGPYTNPSQCVKYFKLVGKANINLLAEGSVRRVTLLNSARTCLSIGSTTPITKDTLQTLGSLACDLTAQEISNSDSYIIQALQSCSSFTASQKSAILQKLKATYGPASTWTVSTMGYIGRLSSTIDASTLQSINKAVRVQYFPGFLTLIKIQYKTVFTFVISQLKVSSRLAARAAPTCDVLTTDMIAKQKEYIVISYTAAQLDECLSNTTLKDNLEILGSLAFDTDQLAVLKKKLDTIFPTTVPEEYLLQIGNIAMMYSLQEISTWNITSVDTLSAVLGGASWATNDMKIGALVTQYLSYPNATLDGTTLTVVAPYICGLNETLIQKIPPNELRSSSQPLDTSTCTQNQKDLLYSKMAATYSSFDNSSNAYFQIMKMVIGGSKSTDLILFAKGYPEMDLTTFTGLNPTEVTKLTAETIKDLLGINILNINKILNSTVMQNWVSANTQTEINKLGLDATGGVQETMPNGFININPAVAQTSGASPHNFVYLLYTCTLAVIFYINNPFL